MRRVGRRPRKDRQPRAERSDIASQLVGLGGVARSHRRIGFQPSHPGRQGREFAL